MSRSLHWSLGSEAGVVSADSHDAPPSSIASEYQSIPLLQDATTVHSQQFSTRFVQQLTDSFDAPFILAPSHSTQSSNLSTPLSSPLDDTAEQSSAIAAVPTAADRKRQRVEKHRVVDAARRSRESKALSTLLELLRDENLLRGRVDIKRQKKSIAPRTRAQVFETAISRLRLMGDLLSAQDQQSPPQSASSSSLTSSALSTASSSSFSSSAHMSWLPYASLFRSAPDAALLFQTSTRRCVDVSDEFCTYTGFSNSQVIGTTVDLCPNTPSAMVPCHGVINCSDRSVAVDAIPEWHVKRNRQQLMSLFHGKEKRVQCLFRVVLSDGSVVDGWFRCWTIGVKGVADRVLVIQANAQSTFTAF